MEIKMKNVSNAASLLALLLVLCAFILDVFGVGSVSIEEALRAALFIKGAFVQVDVSCWINAFRG